MLRKRTIPMVLAASPLAFLVACGGGGGGGEVGSGTQEITTALTGAVQSVPVVGQLLSDCTGEGLAIVNDFAGAIPAAGSLTNLPVIGDVLALADPNMIPILGGFVPGSGSITSLVPISIDDALSMIPVAGLSGDLPVIGTSAITCSDLPIPTGSLTDPTNVLALIPVFGAGGDPVSLVLATVSNLQGGGLPVPNLLGGGLPIPTDVALPSGTGTLPVQLGSVLGPVTSLLGLLGL